MRQVPLVTCKLLSCTKITVNSAYLRKGHTAWLYSFWDSYGRFSRSKTISLRRWQSALLCLKRSVNFKVKDASVTCSSVLAGFHEHMHNSCKQRAECLHRSFVTVHTKRGQWQAPSIQEKSAYLEEVGVMEQILRKSPNSQKSWGNWACANSVYQALFSLPMH